MAEFPDFSVWSNVQNEISFNDKTWIGLVIIEDKAWWTGGRQFLSKALLYYHKYFALNFFRRLIFFYRDCLLTANTL